MPKALRYHDGSPMKPARSRPVRACPPTESDSRGEHESLAGIVRRVFADLGESIPDDLLIYTPPGIHHAGDEVILEGMTDAIPALRIGAGYGRDPASKTDDKIRRTLLLMQRNSLRRAAFRRHLRRDPGSTEPAWSKLHHPLILALETIDGNGPQTTRPGLDVVTTVSRLYLAEGRITVSELEKPNRPALLDMRVELFIRDRLPETLLEVLRNTPGMPLTDVIGLPACGVLEIDDAVSRLRISGIDHDVTGTRLHLEPTRLIHHPDIPGDIDMGAWLAHLERHPPIR